MIQSEFEALIKDATKKINGNIIWTEDQDHSPTLEFQVEVESEAKHPIYLKGSYNPSIQALSYTLIHRSFGRIYSLDMGKDHKNPSGAYVGDVHKHRWNMQLQGSKKDREAYVPTDITALVTEPLSVWKQFCVEANITHNGIMFTPPPQQLRIF